MSFFTVGIAQNIAGLPAMFCVYFRDSCHICMIVVASNYTIRHALKNQADTEMIRAGLVFAVQYA